MVAPIRDLGNITSNILTICESTLNITANDDKDMGVDSFDQLFQGAYDNFDNVIATTRHSRTNDLTTSKAL